MYYSDQCDDIGPHTADPCDEGEYGRVRSIAFINANYAINDPTNPVDWQTGIDSGDIIIVPETNGLYDGGKPKYLPGFGQKVNKFVGNLYDLKVKDPNYKANYLFYNGLTQSGNFKVAFCTSSQVQMADVAATIVATAPVADDLQSLVLWEVDIQWISKDAPRPYDIPAGIFVD